MEEFDIYIRGFLPARRGATVEGLRRIFGLDAQRAHEFIQSVPRVVKRRVAQKRAEQYERALKEIGAVYELRPSAIRPAQIIAIASGAGAEEDPLLQRSGRTLNLPAPMLDPPGLPSVAPPPGARSVPAPPPAAQAEAPPLDRVFASVRPPEPGFPSIAAPPMSDSTPPPGLVRASTAHVLPPPPRVPAEEPATPRASLSTATLPEHVAPSVRPPGAAAQSASPTSPRGVPTWTDPDRTQTTGAPNLERTAPEYVREETRGTPERAVPGAPAATPPAAADAARSAIRFPRVVEGWTIDTVPGDAQQSRGTPSAPAPAISAMPSAVWAPIEPLTPPSGGAPPSHGAAGPDASGLGDAPVPARAAARGADPPFAGDALEPPAANPVLGVDGRPDWIVSELAFRQKAGLLASQRPPPPSEPPDVFAPGGPVPFAGAPAGRGRLPGAVAGPPPAGRSAPPPSEGYHFSAGVVRHSPGIERAVAGEDDPRSAGGTAFAHALSGAGRSHRPPLSARVPVRATRAAVPEDASLPLPLRVGLRALMGLSMFVVLMGLRHCNVAGTDVEKALAAWARADFGAEQREPALQWMEHGSHLFIEADKDRVGGLIKKLIGAGAVQVYATDITRTGPTWISHALLVELPSAKLKRRAVLVVIRRYGHADPMTDEPEGFEPDPHDDGRPTVKINL